MHTLTAQVHSDDYMCEVHQSLVNILRDVARQEAERGGEGDTGRERVGVDMGLAPLPIEYTRTLESMHNLLYTRVSDVDTKDTALYFSLYIFIFS
ncbi:hypothetical protein KIPB_016710, partial [Kipferlia bialata]|eukprot:g16710.t1